MRPVFFLLVLVAAADQAVKFGIQRLLLENQRVPVIPGVFSLTHVLNLGASFWHSSGPYPLILFMTVVAFCPGFLLPENHPGTTAPFPLGLGLGLGSALGNFIDRVRLG